MLWHNERKGLSVKQVTTFAQRSEFEKAAARLEALGLPYETISPDPGYSRVGAPALVLAEKTRLALEIFKRLPKTNCRVCGEATCLAFAVRVQMGELPASKCTPVFQGALRHLKDALVEICMGVVNAETPS